MKRNTLYSLLLILSTLLVFSRVPKFDFVLLDDTSHIDNNPYFSPLNVSNISNVWKHPHMLYMPLTYSAWALAGIFSEKSATVTNARTLTGIPKEFRFKPLLFHLLTLGCHILAALTLLGILNLLTQSPLSSFLGALLFAIHPVQVEPVAWVSGLKDTLSGFLSLLCLLFFILAHRKISSRMKYYGYFSVSTLCLLLALLSKPSAIALPFLAITVASLFYPKARFWTLAKPLLLWVFLTLPFGILVTKLQASESMGFPVPTFFQRGLIALDSMSFYLYKLALPLDLAVDYGRNPSWVLTSRELYSQSTLCLLFLFALNVYFVFYKIRWALWVEAFILIALLPTLGFIPFVFQTTSNVSDRYLYLALAGFSFAVSLGLREIIQKPEILTLVLGLFVALGTRSYFQSSVWQNSTQLFTHNLVVNPRSWLSHNNLGSTYERREEYDQALYHYGQSGEIKPQGICYNNIGAIQLTLQRFNEAKAAYERALAINPLSGVDYHGLGLAYRELGNLEMAEDSFQKAAGLAPELFVATNALRQIRRELLSKNKKISTDHHGKSD